MVEMEETRVQIVGNKRAYFEGIISLYRKEEINRDISQQCGNI
jgi:hypothetical protein